MKQWAAAVVVAVLSLAAAMSAQDVPPPDPQQPSPHKRDIAAIAKEAKGAVVLIVMSDKDGHSIAQGSGFLIGKDGRIVTNYHVIKSGNSAIIKLPDGAFFAVDGVLAFDKDRDVAIIKAHGNDFRTLALGDSDRLQIGEEVVAIGSPLSLESTVSNGIISGIRREEEKRSLLQITAPISPGSSGGPLFNMAGQVVGITTAHLKGGENLNFAIPVNDMKAVLVPGDSQPRVFPNEPDDAATADEGRNGPSLEETTTWIHGFVEDHGFDYATDGQGHYLSFTDHITFNKCATKLIHEEKGNAVGLKFHTYHASFDLGIIDPESITTTGHEVNEVHKVNLITNGLKQISLKQISYYRDEIPLVIGTDHVDITLKTPEAASRVAKALRHAVELCGGKASAF